MQVSSVIESDQFAVVGGGRKRDFKIAESAHAFKILSSALYSDKETAVVRETICNAKDAHIAAGHPDKPIEIELTKNELVIRDFGTGIHDEKIGEVYLVFFGSSKTDDDSQIGGFGLGCKAPFALTDHFMVTSCHEGIQTTYALTVGNEETDGKPAAIVMAQMKTLQSGLTVKIPIVPTMHHKIDMAIRRIVHDGGIKATLNGEVIETRDYTGIAEAGFGLFPVPVGETGGQTKVLYGSVLYPLESQHETRKMFDRLSKAMGYRPRYELVLYAPPSSLAVTPSREKIGYNEKSLNTVEKIGKRALTFKQFARQQKKAAFFEYIHGTQRHQYATLIQEVHPAHSPHWPKEKQFIGPKAVARALAWSEMSHSRADNPQFAMLAATYYRHHAKGMKQKVLKSWNVNPLCRDQYQFVLRKIMRAVMPTIQKPEIVFRPNSASRFGNVNKALTDFGRHYTMGMDCMTLTIAPSRVAASTEGDKNFFLMHKDFKPGELDAITARAERLGLKVKVVKPAPRVAPKPRVKTRTAEEVEGSTFAYSKFEFVRTTNPRSSSSLYVAPVASINEPDSFIALAISRKKLSPNHPKKPSNFIGPWLNYDYEEMRFYQCVDQVTVNKFNRQEIDLSNTALPTSIAQRDALVKAGVPRAITLVLEQLQARFDKRKVSDAFLAYCALAKPDTYYRHSSGHEPANLAMRLSGMSRRMACAVYMQPYKASKDLDETFEMWRNARNLFALDMRFSEFIDEKEGIFFSESKAEFDSMVDGFDQDLPKEMAEFLRRIRHNTVRKQDVAHLKFLSKIIGDVRYIDENDHETIERLAIMVEQEGKRYLALDTKEKPIKRNSVKELENV